MITRISAKDYFITENEGLIPFIEQKQMGDLGNLLKFKISETKTQVYKDLVHADFEIITDLGVGVIETQFGVADPRHIGEIQQYIVSHEASFGILLAENFTDQRINLIKKLNDTRVFNIYAIEYEVYKLSDGGVDIKFNIIVDPVDSCGSWRNRVNKKKMTKEERSQLCKKVAEREDLIEKREKMSRVYNKKYREAISWNTFQGRVGRGEISLEKEYSSLLERA